MLRWFLHRKLRAEEKKMGESAEYLHHIVDVSPRAFLRFIKIMPFASTRKTLPKDAWFVAQIVAVQDEDCGPCVQICVNFARRARVDPTLLQAAVDGNIDDMSQEMVDVYQFTKSVVTATGEEDTLRETLRERYGEHGLIELSYAIAGSRIFPTIKRSLGYAKSCSLVPVEV